MAQINFRSTRGKPKKHVTLVGSDSVSIQEVKVKVFSGEVTSNKKVKEGRIFFPAPVMVPGVHIDFLSAVYRYSLEKAKLFTLGITQDWTDGRGELIQEKVKSKENKIKVISNVVDIIICLMNLII